MRIKNTTPKHYIITRSQLKSNELYPGASEVIFTTLLVLRCNRAAIGIGVALDVIKSIITEQELRHGEKSIDCWNISMGT